MNSASYLVLLFPVALAVDMLPGTGLGVITRLVILISLLGSFAALPGRLSRTELKWVLLLIALFVAQVVSVFMSTDRAASALDLGRQAYALIVAVAFTFSCRQLAARRVLIGGMILPAALSSGIILWSAWKFRDLSTEQLKAAAEASNIQLNPIAGMAAMAVLLVATLAHSWKIRAGIMLFAFAVIAASGARTTLISLVTAITMVACVRYFGLRNTRAFILLGILLVLFVACLGAANILQFPISETEAARITSGRIYLWRVAWESFLERPVFGWGADTWKASLASFAIEIPARWRVGALKLDNGAYHNAYLAWLAERGIVVTLIGLAALWMVMRKAWYLFSVRHYLTGFDRRVAETAPALMLVIALRGLGEVSGLLSYADGVDDFLAFVAAGLIISVAAALESAGIRFVSTSSLQDAAMRPDGSDPVYVHPYGVC